MSVFNFALYTICNTIRQIDFGLEAKQALYRIMGDVYLKPSVRKVWEDTFGFGRDRFYKRGAAGRCAAAGDWTDAARARVPASAAEDAPT